LVRRYTPAEQSAREAHLERFLQSVEDELRELPSSRKDRRAARSRVTSAFADFAKCCLDLDGDQLDLLLHDGFSSISTQLAREARRLDPAVSAADIFQASRNAWTAVGLQSLMGLRMRLTPAIFAYSMLYPYTDNYVDDGSTSLDFKLAFSERFRRRLEGSAVAPFNEREAKIWRFIELIENQYPRDRWPLVHASLLAIHHAQEKSVRILRVDNLSAHADVLTLSFEKGGASVLADAYLAAGSLSPEEARAAFNWGVLLQLVDDLQDVQEDLHEGILTIFTESVARGSGLNQVLDDLTARTLSFGCRVMKQIDRLSPGHSAVANAVRNTDSLKQMIRMSYSLLLVWSAGESARLFSSQYISELETHSPFRFACIAANRKKLARWSGPLNRLFESFLEDEEEDETAPALVASFLLPRAAQPATRGGAFSAFERSA